MWEISNNQLCKTFAFKDFVEAMAFMNRVAIIAEELNHHPEWTNIWNTVSFKLSTHDAGNIVTQKDRELSERIDEIFSAF